MWDGFFTQAKIIFHNQKRIDFDNQSQMKRELNETNQSCATLIAATAINIFFRFCFIFI